MASSYQHYVTARDSFAIPMYHYFRWGRTALIVGGIILVLALAAFGAIVGILLVPTHRAPSRPVTQPAPAVKYHYLALGDSLAFGFQPNFDWDQGYAYWWWLDLQTHGSRDYQNYACSGSTTQEMIHGGCPYSEFRHNYNGKPQLAAAIAYINHNKGNVGPISLDIGADDMLPIVNEQTCSVDPNAWRSHEATVDRDLTQTILPQLIQALTVNGKRTGQLILMNYYDPFQNKCPDALKYIEEFNQHLANDAKQFSLPIADVFQAFGGAKTPNPNLCNYTWMCHGGSLHSIHPSTEGYKVIAKAFEKAAGY